MSLSISGIFGDPTVQSLKLSLSAAVARHQAIANNVANLNTPGYQRVDLSGVFQTELQSALGQLAQGQKVETTLRPQIGRDLTPRPTRLDGNNVNLDHEMVQLAQNNAQHEFALDVLRRRYSGLRMAITGRGA